MSALIDRVTEVFQDVFDDDSLVLSPETTASDVDGWDSLMHVRLMIAVEKAFTVRFLSSEVAALKNVGELLALLTKKGTI